MIFSFIYFLCIYFTLIEPTNAFGNVLPDEYLGSTGKHLFHFVHVTDIHVTHFDHADRMEQFEGFCNQIIKSLIKPQVTVVSGDLVHNRDKRFSSAQYEEEWIQYRDILNRTKVTEYTAWLDMRGNHDSFMDADPQSNHSFYRIYSNQGVAHNGSYQYTLKTNDGDTYSFVGIDMCPRPGPGRPFNFLGHISKEEMKNIEKLSQETRNSNTTVFFGHYPLSFTYSKGLDDLMDHAIAFLNGHLHISVKELYARHSNGLLELELGDWKDHRIFRIITIDSGLLSFEDVRYDQPIYAVISNPKRAKFKTPREPLDRLSQSTHIRILIFSKWPITDVSVSIDARFFGNAKQSIDNQNLYVLSWNASVYNDGHRHLLSVQIKDNQNNAIKVDNDFSLDTSTITVWNRSKLVLTIHWPTLGMICITSGLTLYIIILLFYRHRAKRLIPWCANCFTLWNTIRLRMMLLCSVDLFYYSLIGIALYHLIGPWYIGYLTDGHFGAVFLWGMIVRGTYIPTDVQTLMGTAQIALFLFPLTLSLSVSCHHRYTKLQSNISPSGSSRCRLFQILTMYGIFLYTIVFILFWSYSTTASYSLAWIISPFSLPLAMFSLFLYIKSQRLQRTDFRLQSVANSREDSISENNVEVDDQQPLISGRRTGIKHN